MERTEKPTITEKHNRKAQPKAQLINLSKKTPKYPKISKNLYNKTTQKIKTARTSQLKTLYFTYMGPGWKYKECHSFKVCFNAVWGIKYSLYFHRTPPPSIIIKRKTF